MEDNDRFELKEVLFNSAAMYAFIARLYRQEVDQTLLDQLTALDFTSDFDVPQVAEGYRMMDTFLKSPGEKPIVDLAVDYASIFLGCGPKQGQAAFPYESVYTSHRGLIMQEARDEVVSIYRSEGMVRDQLFSEPEDHIAFELVYMEFLCSRVQTALQNGEDEIAGAYLEKQKDFLQKHLMNWVPGFCADVERIAASDFYKAVAKITVGYLQMEQELLEELVLN